MIGKLYLFVLICFWIYCRFHLALTQRLFDHLLVTDIPKKFQGAHSKLAAHLLRQEVLNGQSNRFADLNRNQQHVPGRTINDIRNVSYNQHSNDALLHGKGSHNKQQINQVILHHQGEWKQDAVRLSESGYKSHLKHSQGAPKHETLKHEGSDKITNIGKIAKQSASGHQHPSMLLKKSQDKSGDMTYVAQQRVQLNPIKREVGTMNKKHPDDANNRLSVDTDVEKHNISRQSLRVVNSQAVHRKDDSAPGGQLHPSQQLSGLKIQRAGTGQGYDGNDKVQRQPVLPDPLLTEGRYRQSPHHASNMSAGRAADTVNDRHVRPSLFKMLGSDQSQVGGNAAIGIPLVRWMNSSFLDNMNERFKQGLIKNVNGVSNLNEGDLKINPVPLERPIEEIGGLQVNWDWDDFVMTFQNYGPAEMKVRRAPHATIGEPWPLPQYYSKKEDTVLTVAADFRFVLTCNYSCDIIDQAMERYRSRIVKHSMDDMYDNLQNAEGSKIREPYSKYSLPLYRLATPISSISLKVRKPCDLIPSMESDESYDLVVKKSSSYLWANEVWGLLRGLETLSQLIWSGEDRRLYIKQTVISDYPRFPHRGILIDTSRHFIHKDVIIDMMDAMEMNKMNVLHWHIVDDQSFPYESEVFPELSAKGAYHPSLVYTLKDITDIIEYGRLRGIRILPEFDSPGHTYSWGLSRPEILTQCYSRHSPVQSYLGPIDPVSNSTYKFLKSLFAEILHVFIDDFIHLGGDEVPLGCWLSNPMVARFGETLALASGLRPTSDEMFYGAASLNMRLVYEYYVNRLMSDIKELGKKRRGIKFIMWQEVMNNEVKLPNDTLIQVWMGDMGDVSRATSLGYNVIYSTCWYLDHIEYGLNWPKYYQCDPVDLSYGFAIDEKKVKGGEACMWSEYIDNENLMQITWPSASAVAERLWSSNDTRSLDSAGERLSEHRCRMLRQGLSVSPVNGPDYCLPHGKRSKLAGDNLPANCVGSGCLSYKSHVSNLRPADLRFSMRATSSGSTECTWLVQVGGNTTFVVLILLLLALVLTFTIPRSFWKASPRRAFRHRSIICAFVFVLFVYFTCYTTIWMNMFQFSASLYRKNNPESDSGAT